jgi:hypothetical protein
MEIPSPLREGALRLRSHLRLNSRTRSLREVFSAFRVIKPALVIETDSDADTKEEKQHRARTAIAIALDIPFVPL